MKLANYNSLFRMTGLTAESSPVREPRLNAEDNASQLSGDDRIAVFVFVLISIILCLAPNAFSASWTQPATDLSKSISSATGPGTIRLTVTNSSSLTKTDTVEIQRTLEQQLRSSGVRIGAATNASSDVHVTLSENLQGYLWVAEIRQGNETKVEMITVPRGEPVIVYHTGPSVTIRKILLWSQSAQILDVIGSDKDLTVLDPQAISMYSMKSGQWQRTNSLPVIHGHPFPRDPRGLLVPGNDKAVHAFLPGTLCDVTNSSPPVVSCHDGDDPWPIAPARSALFNSGRNYFTGALIPASAKSSGPFYSAVSLDRRSYTLSVFTGVDGRVRTNDGSNERQLSLPTTADWGSDIAAVRSQCGAGTQILVTSAGDDTMTDSLRAFEIPDREPVQVSTPLDFPGPITALWSHGDTAIAVAQNLRTGSYEAYSVSVTCNQ